MPPPRRPGEPEWSVVLLDRVNERRRFALGLGLLAAAGYATLAFIGFGLGWAARFLLEDGGHAAPGWLPWVAMLLLPGLLLLPVPVFLATPDPMLDVDADPDLNLRTFLPYGGHAAAGEVLWKTLCVMPQTLAEAIRVVLPGRGWTPDRLDAGATTLATLLRADGWVPMERFVREADVATRDVLPGLLRLDLVWTRPAPMTRESPGGEPLIRLDPQLVP